MAEKRACRLLRRTFLDTKTLSFLSAKENARVKTNHYKTKIMSNEIQPIRIETGEEVAFELMKFIAEKENKNPAPEEVRDYYLDLFVECARAVYEGERMTKE
jgi:hypothetical protein